MKQLVLIIFLLIVGTTKGQSSSKLNQDFWLGYGVKFKVFKKIPRCSATSLVPDSDVVDINLPKKLREIYGHINMGIYLKPLTDGKINISDQIKITT